MQAKDLIEFEEKVFNEYNQGKIKGVIHLSGSADGKYEKILVNIFKKIKKDDWVFSNHRNHYHMLLKAGKKFTMNNIRRGESMHQFSKKYKVYTSGIVGGSVPAAVGAALAFKLKKKKNHVWCFVGDMASQMGCFHEAHKYSIGHDLPITFIIENNDISVCTPTMETWPVTSILRGNKEIVINYQRKYPHHGTGRFIHF